MICPFSKKEVNPRHCENKKNSKPLIGMSDQFAECRVCQEEIPTNNDYKHVTVKSNPPPKPQKLSKKEIAKQKISLIREDSPVKSIGQIEKDVPIPSSPRFTTYPFEEMDIGDSFLIKTKGKSTRQAQNSIATAARRFGLKFTPERKFVTRKNDSEIRVWRIE